ncbi:single-stranded DNA-binding protein [Streptomyces silvensis]|uniref:single-stranded DNA-binding protein n=1 Tax=Streptomyces silvensis TaxID=1765722 RepID=UPI00099E3849|nr:single-stranded DNA-binding protein [Streptomyces silvensis]
MNDTMVTVVGNVATTPVFRELPSGPVTRFRIAVTSRHFDRARNAWADGHTNFFTVWARRTLGLNAQSSLSVGEPVVVRGRLRVRDEERGGQHWQSADIDAHTIGHDLARGTSAFRRAGKPALHSRKDRSTGPGTADEPEFELPAPGAAEEGAEFELPPPGAAEKGAGTADVEVGEGEGAEETEREQDAVPVG